MPEPQYGEPWKDTPGYQTVYDETGEWIVDVACNAMPEDRAAFRRRIVACVNFCRYIPDSGLVGTKPVGIPLGEGGLPHVATAIRCANMIGATEIRLEPNAFAVAVEHYKSIGCNVAHPSFYIDGCLIMQDPRFEEVA